MTNYKITGYFQGVLYAMYNKGVLEMLITDFASNEQLINNNDQPPGWDMFPLKEFDLLHSELLSAKQLVPKTVAEKVALFCLLYKKHKAVPYRATKEEKANLKLVTVNEQLLNTYFTHTAYPLTHTKTMADYVRHYNTVRDLSANGTPQKKSGFPDVYDHGYERTISDDVSKLQRYWEHLRNLGWRKVDGVWLQNSQITTRKS